MNRKMLLCTLMLAVAVIAIPGQAAAATSTPYFVPPNQTLTFVVMGQDASLSEVSGDAAIAAKVPLEAGLLRVDVRCDSLVACLGFVIGH